MYFQSRFFSLRPFQKGDEASLALYANNKEIARFLTNQFPNPYTYDDALVWIDFNQNQTILLNFAIVVGEDVVGGIGLIPGIDIHQKSMAVGYWLGQPFWGKGIATEACKWITGYAFKQFDINRVWASVFSNNQASMRVLEKSGYKYEATLKSSIFKFDQYFDENIYALLRNDWINKTE